VTAPADRPPPGPGRADCGHAERIDGVCVACGHCAHDLILNRACYHCGTTDLDPAALSHKDVAADVVPVDRLRRRRDDD
jgi:hypothetical protein